MLGGESEWSQLAIDSVISIHAICFHCWLTIVAHAQRRQLVSTTDLQLLVIIWQ